MLKTGLEQLVAAVTQPDREKRAASLETALGPYWGSLRAFAPESLGPFHAVARGMVRMRETPQRAAAILDYGRKNVGHAMRGEGARSHTTFFGEGATPQYPVRADTKQPKGILAYIKGSNGIEPKTVLAPNMYPNRSQEVRTDTPFRMPTVGLGAYPSGELPSLAQMLKEPHKHEGLFKRMSQAKGFDLEDLKNWGVRPDRASLEDVLSTLNIMPEGKR